jgi:hypothetical protein
MKTKLYFGMIVGMVLAVGLVLAGCDGNATEEEGYTFKFKVDNSYSSPITKIEFINGNTKNDKVVGSRTLNLVYGERSSEYKVSGFTVESGSRCVFGVKVTFDNGNTTFNYGSAAHNAKILATVSSSSVISFSEGNW